VSITASLSIAIAVFLGLDAAALALMVWPPVQGKRTHGALIAIAVVILLALSLLSGNG
jgi:hypothetical protein